MLTVPVRWLNLQEYQSKGLMERHGLTIQRFRTADNAKEAVDMAHDLSKFIKKGQHLNGNQTNQRLTEKHK